MRNTALTFKAFTKVKNAESSVAKLFACVLLCHHISLAYADVDDADSLDFESFHETDNNVKTWELQSKTKQEGETTNPQKPNNDSARTFEVREPYSNNSQSMSAAISNGYLQMGRYCPNGWKKLGEWSEQDDGANYLYLSLIHI